MALQYSNNSLSMLDALGDAAMRLRRYKYGQTIGKENNEHLDSAVKEYTRQASGVENTNKALLNSYNAAADLYSADERDYIDRLNAYNTASSIYGADQAILADKGQGRYEQRTSGNIPFWYDKQTGQVLQSYSPTWSLVSGSRSPAPEPGETPPPLTTTRPVTPTMSEVPAFNYTRPPNALEPYLGKLNRIAQNADLGVGRNQNAAMPTGPYQAFLSRRR